MSFDKNQFRDLIERVLKEYDLESRAAVNLLLGTAAQESLFGTYIRQMRGPALGIFQMEPRTFIWLQEHYKKTYPNIRERKAEDLEWDLRLAIVFARLRYRIVPVPLPDADDVLALAEYWKEHYNTERGKGTIEQFVENWNRFVG